MAVFPGACSGPKSLSGALVPLKGIFRLGIDPDLVVHDSVSDAGIDHVISEGGISIARDPGHLFRFQVCYTLGSFPAKGHRDAQVKNEVVARIGDPGFEGQNISGTAEAPSIFVPNISGYR